MMPKSQVCYNKIPAKDSGLLSFQRQVEKMQLDLLDKFITA